VAKGSLSTLGTFRQKEGEADSVTRGQVTYLDTKRYFQFGETTATTSRFGIFNSSSLLGSLLRFNAVPQSSKNVTHEINFFGGSTLPSNLLETALKDPLYGANYSFTRYLPKKILPDFANASAFSYQGKGNNSTLIGGVGEANYHVGKNISLGGGMARGEGGYAGTFRPAFEKERGLLTGSYTYINHGLTEIGQLSQGNDEHNASLDTQWLLKDDKTILGGSVTHEMSLPKGNSEESSTTTTSGNFSFSKRLALRKFYGLSYSATRFLIDGKQTLSNGMGGNLVYPLSKSSRVSHNLQYTRSDLGTSANGMGFSTAFDFERRNITYDSTLSTSVAEGDNLASESLSLDQSLQWAIKDGVLELGANYTKPSLRDSNTHQFIFSQLFNYPLTSLQWFSVASSLSLLKSGSVSTVNGSMGLVYRRFFGPAVVSDPLWKRLFKGGGTSSVEGNIFWDKNYNSFLDEEDTPIAGAHVFLDKGSKAITDKDGHFTFKSAKPGEHQLHVERESIPLPDPNIKIPEQTFTTNGHDTLNLPIPLTIPKATLRIQFLLDTNDNRKADETDGVALILHAIVTLPSGEIRTISTRGQGGTLVQGIDTGKVAVRIDPAEMPESIQSLGPVEQKLTITNYDEYTVIFLFKPTRGLQGRVVMAEGKPLPRNMTLKLGKFVSTVDGQGYFWLKDLTPGTYDFTLTNIPKGYCKEAGFPSQLIVPTDSFVQSMTFTLTDQCAP